MANFNIFGEEADFPFQSINLIFLIIPIVKAAIDVFLFEKKGKAVNHNKHLLYALVAGLVFSFIDWRISPVTYLAQSMLLGVGYYFVFFDYVRNLFAGKNIFYIDYDGTTDKVEDSKWDTEIYAKLKIPGVLFVKFWVGLLSLSVYYLMTLITG